jgi:hypothetical protein
LDFDESALGSPDRIFGIDPHILDGVNLDKNSPLGPNGLEDQSGDEVATDDEFVVFEFDDANDRVIANVWAGASVSDSLSIRC